MRDKINKILDIVTDKIVEAFKTSPPDFTALNDYVAEPHHNNEDHIVPLAVLRSTYVHRRWLPAWIGLRDDTKVAFDAKGLDTTKLLFGLFDS